MPCQHHSKFKFLDELLLFPPSCFQKFCSNICDVIYDNHIEKQPETSVRTVEHRHNNTAMVTCSAINCGNSSTEKSVLKVKGWHKVPTDKKLRKQWINSMRRDPPYPSDNTSTTKTLNAILQ